MGLFLPRKLSTCNHSLDSFDGDYCTSKSLTAVLMSKMNQFDNTVDTQVLEQTDLADENARLDAENKPYDGETIVVNGVERPTKNSNGERIAKSAEALRNFWNWFGASQVVDEQGRPLVVYHGTPSGGFDTFIKDSFFTDDKNNARGYAEIKYNTIAPKGQVFSVYLKMSNPFVFDAKGHFWNTLDYKDKTVDGEKIAKIAKKSGYDGVIIQNVKDPAQPWSFVKNTTDYIVFDSYNDKFNQTTSALRKIANGVEEATVKDLRNDLTQYGGTNDITFVWGNERKGIAHIINQHTANVLPGVFDAIVDGKIIRYSQGNKTVVVEKNGIEAVLSLDEHGNTKTWLLTGWDTSISKDAEREFNATLGATQDGPTFSRSELGALLTQFTMTQPYKNVNSQIKSTQNRGTFSPDTGNVYHQRTQANGYYDAELKVIVLGRNMNTMTLPCNFFAG